MTLVENINIAVRLLWREFWLVFGWRIFEVVASGGVACLAALRSYTLFGLSGCVVKFSFFTYFFCRNSIRQRDYCYRSAFILLDQATPTPHSLIHSQSFLVW